MDPKNIDAMLDRLTPDEIRRLARGALLSHSWHQAGTHDDYQHDYEGHSHDALEDAMPVRWDAEISRLAEDGMVESDFYDDVARANAHRHMLGLPTLDNDGNVVSDEPTPEHEGEWLKRWG